MNISKKTTLQHGQNFQLLLTSQHGYHSTLLDCSYDTNYPSYLVKEEKKDEVSRVYGLQKGDEQSAIDAGATSILFVGKMLNRDYRNGLSSLVIKADLYMGKKRQKSNVS